MYEKPLNRKENERIYTLTFKLPSDALRGSDVLYFVSHIYDIVREMTGKNAYVKSFSFSEHYDEESGEKYALLYFRFKNKQTPDVEIERIREIIPPLLEAYLEGIYKSLNSQKYNK